MPAQTPAAAVRRRIGAAPVRKAGRGADVARQVRGHAEEVGALPGAAAAAESGVQHCGGEGAEPGGAGRSVHGLVLSRTGNAGEDGFSSALEVKRFFGGRCEGPWKHRAGAPHLGLCNLGGRGSAGVCMHYGAREPLFSVIDRLMYTT